VPQPTVGCGVFFGHNYEGTCGCRLASPGMKKKPTWSNTVVLDHVGVLVNGLPGTAELPLI
jgi:hypothetical protein